MSRKTIGNGTTSRRKKAATSIQPPAVQDVAEVQRKQTINLDDEIRRRAYEIYLERRGTGSDEHHDWLDAEREIRARHQQGYSA